MGFEPSPLESDPSSVTIGLSVFSILTRAVGGQCPARGPYTTREIMMSGLASAMASKTLNLEAFFLATQIKRIIMIR